jgi:hypothetical protein
MLQELRNIIDFTIRNNTKYSRKNFEELNPELIKRNLQENLYTEDVLRQYLAKMPRTHAKILDVGCKNWFYAQGEYNFFKSFCNEIQLDGIELDAHRLYSNFYSRYEVAKYYIRSLNNTNYISGNLLDIKNNYDYIIWFLPFVLKEPHRYWGLPLKYFYPQKLLMHAYSLLNEGGQMLIINQGEVEAEAQVELFRECYINYISLGEITSTHFKYQNSRYGYLVNKSL